jgi:hypothetical protein
MAKKDGRRTKGVIARGFDPVQVPAGPVKIDLNRKKSERKLPGCKAQTISDK